MRWWIVLDLQAGHFPAIDKLDRVSRADSAARLAESAVCGARRKVRFDRVERTNLNALVAVDAGRFDLPLRRSKQVAQ